MSESFTRPVFAFGPQIGVCNPAEARQRLALTARLREAIVSGDKSEFESELFAGHPGVIDAPMTDALTYGHAPAFSGDIACSIAEFCMRQDRLGFLLTAAQAAHPRLSDGTAAGELRAWLVHLGTFDFPGRRTESWVRIAEATRHSNGIDLICVAMHLDYEQALRDMRTITASQHATAAQQAYLTESMMTFHTKRALGQLPALAHARTRTDETNQDSHSAAVAAPTIIAERRQRRCEI